MINNFNQLGDLLLKRYTVDFIAQLQKLKHPYTCIRCHGNKEPCKRCAGVGVVAIPLGELNENVL